MDRPLHEILNVRKIASQNIVNRLIKREIFGAIKPGTQPYVTRSFYQNIFPSFALVNVDKPPCFLRKFSPSGRYFIAFSSDQTSVEVYVFQGCCAANDLVYDFKGELIGHKSDPQANGVRSSVFDRFFKLKYTVNVAPSGEQLNRECSLFTEDGRFVIVGSASYIPEELRPCFYEIYTNNESTTPNHRSLLEDYTLHIVDLYNGKLCDSKKFRVDKIYLSHNQGVYLYKDTLAVLSVQHQTIYIFQIVDGIFILVRKIGRFCYDDDDFILSSVYPHLASSNRLTQPFRPFAETSINALKHKLLVFLFRLAQRNSDLVGHPLPIRNFFRYFDQVRGRIFLDLLSFLLFRPYLYLIMSLIIMDHFLLAIFLLHNSMKKYLNYPSVIEFMNRMRFPSPNICKIHVLSNILCMSYYVI